MKRLSQSKLNYHGYEDGVNPMDGVANLADTMLVLAVGIMLALIINWNLDIEALHYAKQAESSEEENAMSFESESMEEVSENAELVDSDAMEKLGTVYFDDITGKYYIIAD